MAWGTPSVLFPCVSAAGDGQRYGTQNEAYAQLNGRLYGVAEVIEQCSNSTGWSPRCVGHGAGASKNHGQLPAHGPALLMRRILGPGKFGRIFWLRQAAPPGCKRQSPLRVNAAGTDRRCGQTSTGGSQATSR